MPNNETPQKLKNLTNYLLSFEVKDKIVILRKGEKVLRASLRDIITGSVDLVKEFNLSPEEAYKIREEVKRKKTSEPLRDVHNFVKLNCIYTKPKFPFLIENELIDLGKEWSLYEAYYTWDHSPPILIYDEEGFVNPRRLDYALTKLEPEEIENILQSLPKSILKRVISIIGMWGIPIVRQKDEDEGLFIHNLSYKAQDIFYRPVPILRDPNCLKEIEWRDYVERDVISYGVEVDYRIKMIREATIMRGLEPRYNPHVLAVTNTGTGKSQIYKVAGEHYVRITDVSFIGTAYSKKDVVPGILHNSEYPICLGQLESQNKDQVAKFLFDYMEDGEAPWVAAGVSFRVKGKATLIFAANPLGSQTEEKFREILDMLTHNPALGRRFGIILYSTDLKPVRKKLSAKEEEKWRENIKFFRAVEEYARPELFKIVKNKRVEDWLNTPIPGYEEKVKDLVMTIDDDRIREFFEAHALAQVLVRAASLNATLLYNLDKIALKEYSIEELLREAEERLKAYMNLNLESIAIIASSMEEMKEYRVQSFFHGLPEYLRHIISAIEHYRRWVRKEFSGKGQIPEELKRIGLDKLPYIPNSKTYTHFSRCISNLRKKRRELDRDLFREVLKIDIIPKGKHFEVEVLSWDPLPIEPLGILHPPDRFIDFISFIVSSDSGKRVVVPQNEKQNEKQEKVDKSSKKGEESITPRDRLNDETDEIDEGHLKEVEGLGESEPTAVSDESESAHITSNKEEGYSCKDCAHFKDGKCEVYTHLSPKALESSWLSRTCSNFTPRGEEDG